ncbi:hypothetical protein HaLaN_12860 [Haematococcus lacustris]|uniref:Uncharacterized protein n=1 Tax=Haematococcus lacustris TaxID=44745 RepID=A0A699ZBK2_HAELA|nr:hypothetical protein HaLaN_12860 [Haematococcus lacustris]
MELGSPRATQQTLFRRSSMATAEDVQQIPGVSRPFRKRSRTEQPNISTQLQINLQPDNVNNADACGVVLGRFLAYLARQQAIVDGSGEGSTTGLVGQQPGGG